MKSTTTCWRFYLVRSLYTILSYLALPVVFLRLYWRGRDYLERWSERLGFIPVLQKSGFLLIHAVSVGEARAAFPLISALQKHYPEIPLLVTTSTLTGSRQVRDMLGNQVDHFYMPYDLPSSIRRFLKRVRPQLVVIMETELWPNLLRECAISEVPVLVANARLSERSTRGYRCIQCLTTAMLHDVTLITAQSEIDAGRFRSLGATRVCTFGNLKYDLVLQNGLKEQGQNLRQELFGEERLIWIAASTHNGEEKKILQAFSLLCHRWPGLLLFLVPRHPERFDNVAKLCQQQGFKLVRRSEQRSCEPSTTVFLGDSMGELLLFYSAADLAFVGGSLVPTGGHNVLEPAALGLPVLFGPHMFNFNEASEQLLVEGAALQVSSVEHLSIAVDRLLESPKLRRMLGARGKMVVERNKGALRALLEYIDVLID
jgi:3-deoxy-D-manno-octulosonic-acid transferase